MQKRQFDYRPPHSESLGKVRLSGSEAAAYADQSEARVPVADGSENAQQYVNTFAGRGAAYVEKFDRAGAGTE